jgi:hypothetical protein
VNIFAGTIAANPQRAHSAGYGPPVPEVAQAEPPSPAAGPEAGQAGPGGPVTPEEIEAEFGPAQTGDADGAGQADAAPDAEPQP